MSHSLYLLLIKVMQKEINLREELSLMLGVDNSYISKLEKGRINITPDKLEQLTKILKTNAHKLLVQEI